jgi:hypothetical protein
MILSSYTPLSSLSVELSQLMNMNDDEIMNANGINALRNNEERAVFIVNPTEYLR